MGGQHAMDKVTTRGLAENPAGACFVGDWPFMGLVFSSLVGGPGHLGGQTRHFVGDQPRSHRLTPLFGWPSRGLAENPSPCVLVGDQSLIGLVLYLSVRGPGHLVDSQAHELLCDKWEDRRARVAVRKHHMEEQCPGTAKSTGRDPPK